MQVDVSETIGEYFFVCRLTADIYTVDIIELGNDFTHIILKNIDETENIDTIKDVDLLEKAYIMVYTETEARSKQKKLREEMKF